MIKKKLFFKLFVKVLLSNIRINTKALKAALYGKISFFCHTKINKVYFLISYFFLKLKYIMSQISIFVMTCSSQIPFFHKNQLVTTYFEKK